MTGWDISPSGVGGVLQKCDTAAAGLSTAGDGMSKSLPSAATSAGTISGPYCGVAPPAGPVAAALGEFLAAKEKDLLYIAARVTNSLKGAADATDQYVKGDLKMAADAQNTALQEPTIDLPAPDGQPGAPDGKQGQK